MVGRRGTFALAMAVVLVAAGLAAGSGSAAGAALRLKHVGTFEHPTYVTQAPGHPSLLFVTEQSGRIMVVRDGHELTRPFLSIQQRVASANQQGLLSMAFDPNYEKNGRFYVDYTNRNCDSGTGDFGGCDIEIDGFRRSASSPLRARAASRRRVIEIGHQPYDYEYGGQLQFGPDGDLYASTGYGGGPEDQRNHSQEKSSLLGKILRLDPKADGGYRVPRSNPFVGKPGRDEIYALGMKNAYRFSFDGDGAWIADVGLESWEEIDHVGIDHLRGANLGFPEFEGRQPCAECGFGPDTPKPPHYVAPTHVYAHTHGPEQGCAVIGGYRVRDPKLVPIDGSYVYADYCSGRLHAFDPQTGDSRELQPSLDLPSSFGEGLDGSIYVLSTDTSKLFKLVAGRSG